MTEHHAISRRAFTLGLGLAALSPFVSLPETAGLGLPMRAAFAEDAPTPAATLDKFVIRLRPAGYFRTASVNQDGNFKGNVCHLFNDGTSSKLILEHVETDTDNRNWYAIRTLLNFEEHKKTGYSIWSVDGDSDKDGKVIHVWSGEYDHKDSRAYTFDPQSDGTYIIRDRIYTKNGINYLAIESKGKDQDNNKICQKKYPIPWELELVGYSMDKTNATVSSIDWTTYSSYVDGPCWMSHVDDNKYLDELSIPGTHDSGTCSVDNDTEPQSSQAKCQQDYIPTQLLEGIRYFDIRLGKDDKNGDPGIGHGRCYLLKKDGGYMHLSDVIGYFKTFLSEKPSEALIMLVSRGNDEATDESVTTAFAKVMGKDPDLFYTSSRVPTLGEVRGKIVLLRRFGLAGNSASGHTWGLDLTQWDDKIAAHPDSSSMCLVQNAQGFEAEGKAGDKKPIAPRYMPRTITNAPEPTRSNGSIWHCGKRPISPAARLTSWTMMGPRSRSWSAVGPSTTPAARITNKEATHLPQREWSTSICTRASTSTPAATRKQSQIASSTLASSHPTLLMRHWRGASTSAITHSTSRQLRTTSRPACT